MRKLISILVLISLLMISACGDSGVQYAGDNTDMEAFFNIINYDYPVLFELNHYNYTVPDTASIYEYPIQSYYVWYEMQPGEPMLTEPIYGERQYPDAIIPSVQISRIQTFTGTLEVIAFDSSNGGQEPVRYSKDVSIQGRVTCVLEKWGLDHSSRRGWLLKEINHAYYKDGPERQPQSLIVNAQSYGFFNVGTGLYTLGNMIVFEPGEEITISAVTESEGDLLRITFPTESGIETVEGFTNDVFSTDVSFNLPNTPQYNHFLIDIIYADSFPDTTDFNSNGWGMLYSTH